MKKSLLLVALSVCLLPLWGQQNFSRIDSLIKKMLPEASEVGISVYDLTAKKSLYNYRAEKLSRPASTMKLLTAITALSRPEAAEPFRTEVWHDGVIEHDTLQGNLYVVGGFDPEFDSQSMDSLIEEVITFPFSVINGQVYGDVSMKDSLYWGSGWAWDDTPAGYQPYLSPLMFCKGTVQVSVVPSTVQGDTASVSCQPVSSYYTVTNQTKTRTSSAGKFSFTRDWLTNGNNLLVSGNVTSIRKDDVNIYDSPRFFMHTFLERLRGKGITTPQSYGFAELPRDSVRVERMACWNTSVLKVLEEVDVKGISHITGGGFYENIPRSLKKGCCARINKADVRTPALFHLMQKVGGISEHDMFNTFNMGVGMVLTVPAEQADKALEILHANGEPEAYRLGVIAEGEGVELC